MKKETCHIASTSDKKAERLMRAKQTVKEMSEIITGRPSDVKRSYLSGRMCEIDSAYNYLSKKLDYEKYDQHTNLLIGLIWGFITGMLFSALMLNYDTIYTQIFKL